MKHDGDDIASQQRISHDHARGVDPSDNPERRREPRVWTNEVSLPSRELDAYRRKQTKNHESATQAAADTAAGPIATRPAAAETVRGH